jgi:hypothetical protein
MSGRAKMGDLRIDANLSDAAQAAITASHDQNTDTDLDSTFEATFEKVANKGANNGYCGLDGSGLVDDSDIPSGIARDSEVATAVSDHAALATGIHGETIVVLGSDQTTVSTSMENLAGLLAAVAVSSTYLFEALIAWKSNNASYGVGFSFTGPANKTIAVHTTIIALTTTTIFSMNGSDYDLPDATSDSPPAADTIYLAHMKGILKTGDTSGNLQLRWRSEHADGTITALIGSTLRVKKVA